jgi:glucosamine--fructose-6-phosphate aminotransferase (isomerizing)
MTDGKDTPPGALMAAEIAEQPEALQRLLDHQLAGIRTVASRIQQFGPRFVMLAARGTSDHAALYAKYLIEITLGLPCGLASPSTMTAYQARPTLRDVLWVTVSQSGGSPDLIESTQAAAECGALTVAVTNAPDSALAQAATLGIDIAAGLEQAVAATKSYTSQLVALYLLIDALSDGNASAAQPLPHLAEDLLDRSQAAEQAARYRFIDKIVATGRGYSYPSARETALKLMETSYLSANAFSGADLLHGPLAMVDQDRPVIAFVPPGPGGLALEPVLQQLHTRGADVLVVGQALPGLPPVQRIPLPAEVAGPLTPVLEIMPMQQMAHAMAVARGYDPDAPRGLKKITATR